MEVCDNGDSVDEVMGAEPGGEFVADCGKVVAITEARFDECHQQLAVGYARSFVEEAGVDLGIDVETAQTEQCCVRRRSIEAVIHHRSFGGDELDLAPVQGAVCPVEVAE